MTASVTVGDVAGRVYVEDAGVQGNYCSQVYHMLAFPCAGVGVRTEIFISLMSETTAYSSAVKAT